MGSTTNVDRRFRDHIEGIGGRTTSLDPPIRVVHKEKFDAIEKAKARESQLKHWSRAKKEALIRGDLPELKRLAKRRTG